MTREDRARKRLRDWKNWADAQPVRDEKFWEINSEAFNALCHEFSAVPWFFHVAYELYMSYEREGQKCG